MKTSLKTLFIIYLAVSSIDPSTATQHFSSDDHPTKMAFKSPGTAFNIIKAFDIYHEIDEKYHDQGPRPMNRYNMNFWGIKKDDFYCDKVRNHFVFHTEEFFTTKKIFTTYHKTAPAPKYMFPDYAEWVQPYINNSLPKPLANSQTFDLDPSFQVLFTRHEIHTIFKFGLQLGCTLQSYTYIPGHGSINRKDGVAESIRLYNEKHGHKKDVCHLKNHFMKTWVLDIEDQCEDFYRYLNSREYIHNRNIHGIDLIRKTAVGEHLGKGVQPVNLTEEDALRDMFMTGYLCGKWNYSNYIVQKYLTNPLLIKNRRIDFRVYLYVASTYPLIAYFHDGFMRVSIFEYSTDAENKDAFLTMTKSSMDVYKKVLEGQEVQGVDPDALKENYWWTFARLESYLKEIGKVPKDANWIDDYLRPTYKRVLVHVTRAAAEKFLVTPQASELFGIDFMLDDNLEAYFIEANTTPTLSGEGEREDFLRKMVTDMLDLSFGYVKSRLKRIVNFVNSVSDDASCVKEVNLGIVPEERRR